MTAFGSHSGQDSFNVPTDLGCASTPQDSQPDALCPCDDFLGVGDLLKGSDARKKKWLQFRRQASNGFVGLPNQLVDSKAFAALTTGASVKTLVWFWGEAKYEKKKRKPGTESPIGKIDKIKNNGEISFTYQVAEWRGLKPRTFYRVLRELHRVGFIDVSRQGRGRKGEYTKYALSSRWQWYNTPEWKEIPFPEGFKEGFRSSEFQENQRKRREKSSGQKSPLPMDNKVPYEIGEALKSGQKSPLKMAVTSHSQRTKKSISIDSVMGCTTSKMNKKKVQTRNSRSKGTAAAIRRDDNPDISFWAEDEPLVHFFGTEATH